MVFQSSSPYYVYDQKSKSYFPVSDVPFFEGGTTPPKFCVACSKGEFVSELDPKKPTLIYSVFIPF